LRVSLQDKKNSNRKFTGINIKAQKTVLSTKTTEKTKLNNLSQQGTKNPQSRPLTSLFSGNTDVFNKNDWSNQIT
jgi:hypothetical protein